MESRPSTRWKQALVRDNKREYGRILLELWVNQVLDNQSTSGTNSLGATAAVQGACAGAVHGVGMHRAGNGAACKTKSTHVRGRRQGRHGSTVGLWMWTER